MIENWEEFYEEIEKLSLPELEAMIKELYQKFQKSRSYSDDLLNACLSQRKYLINRNFIFTPEAVYHIERVNSILTKSTAKVLNRTEFLYRQMVQLKAKGDDFLDDFNVDGTVAVGYSGEESILTFDKDENSGQSDYHAMADVLDFTNNAFEYLRRFSISDGGNLIHEETEDKFIIDHTLELNWNIELLSAPELSSIEYFCYASHILFVDSRYSLSDIIRINDFRNEVKVTHQNWGEKLTV